jgi:hypothetical protein
MGLRFRQSFRLWKGASIIWNAPLTRRGKKKNANFGFGCLGLGMIGAIAFLALLGLVAPRSPGEYSASATDYTFPASLQATVPESANGSLPSVEEPPAMPIKEAILKTESQRLEPTSMKPAPFKLEGVDAAKIFARLDLASKGFEFKRNAENNPLFWTLRKADADREYTAVFLAGDNGKPKAITLELVSIGSGIDGLARNYFKTLVGAFMPASEAKEAENWIMQLTSSMESKTIAGLQLTWNSTSSTHRRLTIQ